MFYSSNRDSSGGKILCEENGVPAVPERIEIDNSSFSGEDAVPDDEAKGNAFIAMAAEAMRRNLAAQGVIVPAFEPTKKQIQAGFRAK